MTDNGTQVLRTRLRAVIHDGEHLFRQLDHLRMTAPASEEEEQGRAGMLLHLNALNREEDRIQGEVNGLVRLELIDAGGQGSQATAPPGDNLPMETLADLLSSSSGGPEAVIPNFAFRGLKTLVVGQSKAGKSVTILSKAVEVARRGVPVLYLTEEYSATLVTKLAMFATEPDLPLYITRKFHEDAYSLPWPKVVERITQAVREREIALVVVDTARPWLRLKGEEGNQDTAIGTAMDLLSPVLELGAAVVVIHQAGWEKLRARGSSEWHATMDVIFGVEGKDDEPRKIRYLGGRVEGIPRKQTLRLSSDGGLEELDGDLRRDAAVTLDHILRTLEGADEPLLAQQIAGVLGLHEKTVRDRLRMLEKAGRVVRQPGKSGGIGGGQDPDSWKITGMFERLALIANQ